MGTPSANVMAPSQNSRNRRPLSGIVIHLIPALLALCLVFEILHLAKFASAVPVNRLEQQRTDSEPAVPSTYPRAVEINNFERGIGDDISKTFHDTVDKVKNVFSPPDKEKKLAVDVVSDFAYDELNHKISRTKLKAAFRKKYEQAKKEDKHKKVKNDDWIRKQIKHTVPQLKQHYEDADGSKLNKTESKPRTKVFKLHDRDTADSPVHERDGGLQPQLGDLDQFKFLRKIALPPPPQIPDNLKDSLSNSYNKWRDGVAKGKCKLWIDSCENLSFRPGRLQEVTLRNLVGRCIKGLEKQPACVEKYETQFYIRSILIELVDQGKIKDEDGKIKKKTSRLRSRGVQGDQAFRGEGENLHSRAIVRPKPGDPDYYTSPGFFPYPMPKTPEISSSLKASLGVAYNKWRNGSALGNKHNCRWGLGTCNKADGITTKLDPTPSDKRRNMIESCVKDLVEQPMCLEKYESELFLKPYLTELVDQGKIKDETGNIKKLWHRDIISDRETGFDGRHDAGIDDAIANGVKHMLAARDPRRGGGGSKGGRGGGGGSRGGGGGASRGGGGSSGVLKGFGILGGGRGGAAGRGGGRGRPIKPQRPKSLDASRPLAPSTSSIATGAPLETPNQFGPISGALPWGNNVPVSFRPSPAALPTTSSSTLPSPVRGRIFGGLGLPIKKPAPVTTPSFVTGTQPKVGRHLIRDPKGKSGGGSKGGSKGGGGNKPGSGSGSKIQPQPQANTQKPQPASQQPKTTAPRTTAVRTMTPKQSTTSRQSSTSKQSSIQKPTSTTSTRKPSSTPSMRTMSSTSSMGKPSSAPLTKSHLSSSSSKRPTSSLSSSKRPSSSVSPSRRPSSSTSLLKKPTSSSSSSKKPSSSLSSSRKPGSSTSPLRNPALSTSSSKRPSSTFSSRMPGSSLSSSRKPGSSTSSSRRPASSTSSLRRPKSLISSTLRRPASSTTSSRRPVSSTSLSKRPSSSTSSPRRASSTSSTRKTLSVASKTASTSSRPVSTQSAAISHSKPSKTTPTAPMDSTASASMASSSPSTVVSSSHVTHATTTIPQTASTSSSALSNVPVSSPTSPEQGDPRPNTSAPSEQGPTSNVPQSSPVTPNPGASSHAPTVNLDPGQSQGPSASVSNQPAYSEPRPGTVPPSQDHGPQYTAASDLPTANPMPNSTTSVSALTGIPISSGAPAAPSQSFSSTIANVPTNTPVSSQTAQAPIGTTSALNANQLTKTPGSDASTNSAPGGVPTSTSGNNAPVSSSQSTSDDKRPAPYTSLSAEGAPPQTSGSPTPTPIVTSSVSGSPRPPTFPVPPSSHVHNPPPASSPTDGMTWTSSDGKTTTLPSQTAPTSNSGFVTTTKPEVTTRPFTGHGPVVLTKDATSSHSHTKGKKPDLGDVMLTLLPQIISALPIPQPTND